MFDASDFVSVLSVLSSFVSIGMCEDRKNPDLFLNEHQVEFFSYLIFMNRNRQGTGRTRSGSK